MRPRVVVLGMLTRMPVPGVVWQTAHYLLGLERLGCETWYVEAHGINPSMFCSGPGDPGSERAAAFLAGTMSKLGHDHRWALHALHDDGRVFGLSPSSLRQLYGSAAAIINLHGGTTPLPEHAATGRLVYLETDPVQLQVELHEGRPEAIAYLEPHAAFFTFAERYGRPGCGLPVDERFQFRPTRQPVVLDLWENDREPGRTWTTVGNWRQSGQRVVELNGESYTWSKHSEWAKVIELPRRVDAPIELALASLNGKDRTRLERHGFGIRDASSLNDPDDYRAYVGRSRGELTVAKDQNVRLRTGWFSDRSATYLASGRPVVTQDTGFGDVLPTGEGLFAFDDLESASDAITEVERDWSRHSAAARSIARDHFDAEVVLGKLLGELGVPS
jgi:hypothetical protein